MLPATAYIALGANLGDPRAQLDRACQRLAALPGTRLVAASPWYRSRPLGPVGQPDYLNGVAHLATALDPLELLDALLGIERSEGRVRGERWGPRTLDLDLLLYDSEVMEHPRLTLPHPELTRRSFVLVPLLDVAPDLLLPDGLSVAELVAAMGREGLERLGPG